MIETKHAPKTGSLARRIATTIAVVLFLGVAAGAGYVLWRRHENPAESASGIQPIGETAEAKPDETKDLATQIVRLSPETMRKYGVRLGKARKHRLVSEIVAPARVAFNSEATAVIATPVQGRVVAVPVRAGDTVDQGAPLLEIESTELGEAQSEYLLRQTTVHTAAAAIRPLTEIFARIKKLQDESRLVGITEVQEREMELRKAEGALAAAQAAVTAADNKLHLLGMDDRAVDQLLKTGKINPRYVVRSPLAGQVIERLVNLGELVKPERERLLVVADTSTLWVWADVPEARAPEVAIGATAQIILNAGVERTLPGVISHIAPSIDSETRSLRVRIDVKNDPAIKPGMFAQVAFNGCPPGESAEAMLVVPQAAVQNIDGNSAVFVPVAGEPNAFQVRKISTGACADGVACVVSGLDEGERIVVAGGAILKADLLKASAKDED